MSDQVVRELYLLVTCPASCDKMHMRGTRLLCKLFRTAVIWSRRCHVYVGEAKIIYSNAIQALVFRAQSDFLPSRSSAEVLALPGNILVFESPS